MNNWYRPKSYSSELETTIKVTLNDQFEVDSITVIKSSGEPSFDQSTIKAIELSSPFIELAGLEEEVFKKTLTAFSFQFLPSD